MTSPAELASFKYRTRAHVTLPFNHAHSALSVSLFRNQGTRFPLVKFVNRVGRSFLAFSLPPTIHPYNRSHRYK